MGGKCPHRKVKKRRYSHKQSRRSKFLLKDILSYTIRCSCTFFLRLSIVFLYIFASLFFLFNPWLWIDHVMTLCTMSYRRPGTRRNPCPLMKIFLGWASITAYTASIDLIACLFNICLIFLFYNCSFYAYFFGNWFFFLESDYTFQK